MSVGKEWRPPYFDLLVAFMADASDQRTIKQFCIDNHLSEDTIYQYKREHKDILFTTVDNVRAKYIPEIRLEAMKAVFANIKKNFNDRKLALQLTGDLIEKTENTQIIRSPEEKRARIDELLSKLTHKPE